MSFTPIEDRYSYRKDGVQTLSQDNTDEITGLLLGHKVTKVTGDHLLLDNGTVIRAIGNEGCGGCTNGFYELSQLNGTDNVITRVEFDYHPDFEDGSDAAKVCNPDQPEYTGHYRIFVYADNTKINLMQVDGSDGNGYYGTGFELLVRVP